MAPLLEVKDLRTQFRSDSEVTRAVDGVSFTLNEMEILAIVGESGSGKTMMASSIMGLVPPPGRIVGGSIHFQGQNLLEISNKQMRQVRGGQISMIFQEPMTSLNPVLTIERQLTEATQLHLGLTTKASKKRALELLQLVQIPDAKDRLRNYPHQFSGGMRQRVMLAMALSCNPKLILADEPTTALDVTVQAQILKTMKDLTRDTGAAMILITHNLGIVARYAERIAVMYAGRIVESGGCQQIFAKPKHPYTKGLLSSLPRLDVQQKRLRPIAGQPPVLSSLPTGCPYRTRCPDVLDRCTRDDPSRLSGKENHEVACWLSEVE